MDIITLMAQPGSRTFWEQYGKHGVHEDFRNAVDAALASGEKSYTMD